MKTIGKSFPVRRMLLVLAVASAGLTTGAFAQQSSAQAIAEVNTALTDLYPDAGLSVNGSIPATATELEYAIQLISSPTGVTVSVPAHGSHAGLNDPLDAAVDIGSVLAALSQQTTATLAEDLVAGFNTAVKTNNTSAQTAYLPAVTGSASAYSNFTGTQAAINTAISGVVSAAITDAPTQFSPILVAAIGASAQSPVSQAALFVTEATTAKLGAGNVTLNQLTTNLLNSGGVGGGVVTSVNTGSFLASVVAGTGVTPANQQAVIQTYTAGETASQLAMTASNIAQNAPSTFTTYTVAGSDADNVMTGLVNSANADTGVTGGAAAVLPGILTGILSDPVLTTDSERGTLVKNFLTSAYSAYAPIIAAAGVTTVSTSDLASYSKTVVAAGGIGSSASSIASVAAALVNKFPLTNIANDSDPNLTNQVAIIQGVISNAPTGVGDVVAIANAVATQGVLAAGGDTNAAHLQAYGVNLASDLGTPGNGLLVTTITDTMRSQLAIGLSQAYQTASQSAAIPAIVSSVAATDFAQPSYIANSVVPVLINSSFSSNSTLVESIVAAVASNPTILANSYIIAGTPITYNPVTLTAALLKNTSVTANVPLIDEIAVGAATSSAVITAYGGTADAFVNALAITVKASTTDINNIAVTLAVTPGFNAPEIAGDIAGAVPVALAATVSGSIAAINTTTNGEAAAIAFAASKGIGSIDADSETISEDVVKDLPSGDTAAAALAISGSVGNLVADANKGTFAEDIAKLSLTNVSAIALAVAQTVATTDGALLTTLETIANDSAKAFTSTDTADQVTLVGNIAANYTGATAASYSAAPTISILNYTQLAAYAKALATDYTPAGAAIVNSVLSTAVTSNPSAIPAVAQQFTADLLTLTYATQVAAYVSANDSSILADAGPITGGVLAGLGSLGKTDVVTVAKAVAGNISGLNIGEAEAITTTAVGVSGTPTAANLNLVTVGVINDLASGSQQTAVDDIAPVVSGSIAALYPTAALTDQENLAVALSGSFPTLNQVSISYDVARTYALAGTSASYTAIANIAAAVLKDATNTPTYNVAGSASAVATYVDALMLDFSSGNTNYVQAAGVAAGLVKDLTLVTGLGNALSAALIPLDVAGSPSTPIGTIASQFTVDLPASYLAVATAATAADNTKSFLDAPAITSSILAALGTTAGATDSPAVALHVMQSITSGSLTSTLATDVADAAGAATGATAAEIETTATNVISVLPTAIHQTAADSIAHDLSLQLLTSATTTALANALGTAQGTLTTDIVKVGGAVNPLDPDQIAANISIYATTDVIIGAIGVDALKEAATITGGTLTTGSVAAFTDTLVSDLTSTETNNNSSFGYLDAVAIGKEVVTLGFGTTLTTINVSNAVAGTLVNQEILAGSGTPVNIAVAFTTALPASAVAISSSASFVDSAIAPGGTAGATEAGNLTTGILGALGTTGLTTAPAIAQAIAANADGGITVTEAEAIAAGAATYTHTIGSVTTALTAANQDLVATDVIAQLSGLSTASQQAALDNIATTVSVSLAADYASVAVTDQEGLAVALSGSFSSLNQVSVVHDVALAYSLAFNSASYTAIANIAAAVLKDSTNAATYNVAGSASAVATYVDALMTDFSSANTNYVQAAGVAAGLVKDLTVVTGLGNALSASLVNQEIADNAYSVSFAETAAATFATALPASAVSIATAATSNTLFTGANALNAGQTGAIGASVVAVLPSTTTSLATLSGTIALLSANAAHLTGVETSNDSRSTVAGVFASNSSIPVNSYVGIATVLGNASTGGLAADKGNSAIPSIESSFVGQTALIGSTGTITLKSFLTAFAADYYVSAADILGVAIYEQVQLGLDTDGVNTVNSALEADVKAAVTAADLTALYTAEHALGSGPFATDSTTAEQAAEWNTLLTQVINTPSAAFEPVATNPEETPIVNM